MKKQWESYEEVALYLLNQFADTFNLGAVEGKQLVPGKSGTNWEIDAKGIKEGEGGFVIIECRRYTSSRLNQESLGGLAYRIQDTGAGGGIIVTPLPLQKGAEIVARHEGIKHIILSQESTTSEYVLQFLNQTFLGVVGQVKTADSVHFEVVRNGKVVEN